MSWFTVWNGSTQRREGKKAEKKADEAFGQQYQLYNDQLTPWQGQYNSGYMPQLGQVQWLQNQMLSNPWMFNTPQGTSGMPGMSSYQGETPWWANVPQNTNDIEPALSTLQRLGMQGIMNQNNARMAQFNAQRGVPMSQEQAGNTPGANTAWYDMLSRENANKALALNDVMTQRRAEGQATAFNLDNLATQRRGEAMGNFFNLGQYGQGLMGGATQIPQIGMNMYGSRMGQQNSNAQNWYQQASQANPFGQLLGVAGYAFGGGFTKPNIPQFASQQPQANYMNSGAGMNYTVGKPFSWTMPGR
jgi:hypothetical protein